MNKLIIPIILGMFLLVSVSAMYPGETKNYSLEDLGLSSITNVSINNSNIIYSFTNVSASITIPYDMIPQEFTMTFEGFKESIPVVVTTSSGGGSSHSKKKVVPIVNESLDNLTIEEWNYTPPIVLNEEPKQEIVVEEEPIINETVDKGGKMIDSNTLKWIILGIVILLVIAVIILSFKKKKGTKKIPTEEPTDNYNEEDLAKEIEELTKKIEALPKEEDLDGQGKKI